MPPPLYGSAMLRLHWRLFSYLSKFMQPDIDHPYERLTPDMMLNALASLNLDADGRMLALSSYENRVYQFYIYDHPPLVVKFYRPERWTREQIGEEHRFALELQQTEIPVVAPLLLAGKALHEYEGFLFAVYPYRGGRSPELDDLDVMEWIGRFLGRIHAVGKARAFETRPTLDLSTFGYQPMQWLLQHDMIPLPCQQLWQSCCQEVLGLSEKIWQCVTPFAQLRLHGDCHPGNILWRPPSGEDPGGPHFVDLDDARMGPAVQDFWMLCSGDKPQQQMQLAALLSGYEQFCEFDWREIKLIEVLRTLRMIHYSYWLAQRWSDPAFPQAFPWFGTETYWQGQIQNLRIQIDLLTDVI